jgi:hypothetical protein
MDVINIHHGKILGKLLLEREISKGEFCKLMGYSPKNYTTNFYKEKLAEKVLEKIGEVLSVDLSIFQNGIQNESLQANKDNIVNGNHVSLTEKELYERLAAANEKLLASKESEIAALKELVAQLKKQLPE